MNPRNAKTMTDDLQICTPGISEREKAILSTYRAGCWGMNNKVRPAITAKEARTYGITIARPEIMSMSMDAGMWYWIHTSSAGIHRWGSYRMRSDALLSGVGWVLLERIRAL